MRDLGGGTVANAGSLRLALDGDLRATCVVIDVGRSTRRRVAYNVEAVAARLTRVEYPLTDIYAEWLRSGRRPPTM